jgi:hypothetical protein
MSRSFPSSRGSITCPRYAVGEKMSNKNLEQRINIKFCVNIAESASETLALVSLAYDGYTIKKSSNIEWHRRFKEGWEDVQDDPRSRQPRMQSTDPNMDRVGTLVSSDRRLEISGNLFGRNNPNSGLTSRFSNITMPLQMVRWELTSSWLRNSLQKLVQLPQ